MRKGSFCTEEQSLNYTHRGYTIKGIPHKYPIHKKSKFHHYTNGLINICIYEGYIIPEGFYPGRTFSKEQLEKFSRLAKVQYREKGKWAKKRD